jgi:hypothetical protein
MAKPIPCGANSRKEDGSMLACRVLERDTESAARVHQVVGGRTFGIMSA